MISGKIFGKVSDCHLTSLLSLVKHLGKIFQQDVKLKVQLSFFSLKTNNDNNNNNKLQDGFVYSTKEC